MAEERIQKIMSEQGLCSRRAAEQIIEEGRVKLNGHPVKLGDKMDPAKDLLTVDGQRILIEKNQQLYYLVVYKPRGFVTTASDELGRRTVMELVKDVPARLYPVGRLDKDSEGLLLMTNDGEFANAMMHPSGGISKLYRVTVRPHADEQTILKLSQGVVLDDGIKTAPCVINVVADEPGRTVMEMTLREGRNREIRRMCEAVGLEVIRLKRSAEGAVKLGMLQPGQYRELTKQELVSLRAAAAKGRAQTRSANEQERARERTAHRRPQENAPLTEGGTRRGYGNSTRPGGSNAARGEGRSDNRAGAGEGRRYGKPARSGNGSDYGRGKAGEGRGAGRPERGEGRPAGRGNGEGRKTYGTGTGRTGAASDAKKGGFAPRGPKKSGGNR